jgi:hypothetical protein
LNAASIARQSAASLGSLGNGALSAKDCMVAIPSTSNAMIRAARVPGAYNAGCCTASVIMSRSSDGAMTRREMILHVVNHYTYHRGFVVDILHRMPQAIPKTDLTVYLCDHVRQ